MAIILPTRWTRQPSRNVKIDRNHPLSRGLVTFVYPGNTPAQGLRATVNGRRVFWCDGNNANSRLILPQPPIRMNGVTVAVYGRYDDDFLAAASVAALAGPSDSSSNSSFGFVASVFNASELFGLDSSVYGTDRASTLNNPQVPGMYAGRKFNGTNTASVYYNNTSYPVSLNAPGTAEFVYNSLKLFGKGTNNVDPPNAGSWTEFVAVWNRSLSDAELAAFAANPWQVLEPDDAIYFNSSTTPTSNGTANQTLESVTQTASGTTPHAGTASQQLAPVTQVTNGTAPFGASANQTLQPVTQNANGATPHAGSASQTLAPIAQNATGTVGDSRNASANQTLKPVTQTSAGGIVAVAQASQNLPSVTQVAGGTTPHAGSASQTLAPITQLVTGTVGDSRNASASQTLAPVTQSASGTTPHVAQASQNLPSVTQVAGGVVIGGTGGTALQSLQPVTQIANGTVSASAQANQFLQAIRQLATAETGTGNRVIRNPITVYVQPGDGFIVEI